MAKSVLGCLLLMMACGGGGGDGGELEPCGPGGTCPVGFECNPVDNLCYRSGTLHPDAGSPTQPDTSITLKPPALSNSAAIQITFSSDVPGATFVCSLDGEAFAPCSSPYTATVTEGTHTFAVAAVSGALQDDTPETWTWQVDLTPPDTTITAGTSGNVSHSEATFTFVSTEPNSTFECKFDDGAFAVCTSDEVFTGFSMGTHTFTVRAKDAAGNFDPEPATRSWTVDATGPTVNVSVSPLVNGKTRANGAVSYSSPESGVTFRCRTYLSTATPPAFGACAQSPFNLSGFTHGQSVKIDVEGRDALDNPSIGSVTVTIDAQGPQITITAPSGRTGRSGTLTFTYDSGVDNTGTFTCSVKDPSGATIASGACTTAAGLSWTASVSGTHTATVNGTDALGNTGSKTQTWIVDADGPITKLGACQQVKPDDPITCSVTVTGGDGKSLQCHVVGLTNFADCGTDLTFVSIPGAAVGLNNVVEVRAVDDVGNVGAPDSQNVQDFIEYLIGHGVLIGQDYLAVNTDTRQLLVNAVNLSYVKQLGLNRAIRVLMWCSTSTCDSTEEATVKAILPNADIKTFFDPPRDLTDLLVGRDVLLIVDQNARHQDIASIGKDWMVSMITNFASRGGTVIVLDGMANDQTPSLTFRVLIGAGVFGASPGGNQTGQKPIYEASDPLLQAGVTNGYTGPQFTVAFIRSDVNWLRSFVINVDLQVVLHRQF